jgi:hypothetical protein
MNGCVLAGWHRLSLWHHLRIHIVKSDSIRTADSTNFRDHIFVDDLSLTTVVNSESPIKERRFNFSVQDSSGKELRQMVVHAVRIDTQNANVKFKVTGKASGYDQLKQITKLEHTEAFFIGLKQTGRNPIFAINASPFEHDGAYYSIGDYAYGLGLLVSDGFKVDDVKPNSQNQLIPRPVFVVKNDGSADLIEDYLPGTINIGQIKTAVSGFAGGKFILKSGLINTTDLSTRPRTGIGLSADKRYVYILAIAGSSGLTDSSLGAGLTEMAGVFKAIGAANAINLDGGGSTTLVDRAPGNNSAYILIGGGRPVAVNLAVLYDGVIGGGTPVNTNPPPVNTVLPVNNSEDSILYVPDSGGGM